MKGLGGFIYLFAFIFKCLYYSVHGYSIKLLQDVFLNHMPTVDKIVSTKVSSARLN